MARTDKRVRQDLGRIAAGVEALQGAAAKDSSRIPAKEISTGREKLPIRARVILWIGGSKSNTINSIRMRRSFPIKAYVGPNGGGKSLCMVQDTIPSLMQGRTVLSTVKLLDPATGRPHPAYVPFLDFEQLLTAEHCDVLMDEVVGIANSRSAASLSVVVQNTLVQLRRRDIVLRWTAPNWARADKIIREVTQAVTECRGYFPGRAAPGAGDSSVRLWAPKRVFQFRTFDTLDFEEWTAGKREKLKAVGVQWMKGPGSVAFRAYDTLDSVNMVAHAAEDGMCSVCGRKKRQELCKGHTPEEVEAAQLALGNSTVLDGLEHGHEHETSLAVVGL